MRSTHTKKIAFAMVTLSALFYLYEFFIRVSTSVLSDTLMQHFSANASAYGTMSACFFWAYMPMQIPAGLLGDRFGPKKILIGAVLLCSIATLLFAQTDSIVHAGFFRFLIGLTASFAYIGPLMIASRWLKPKSFAMASGFIQMLGCLGAILGGAPVALLERSLGWQQAYHWIAGFGVILSIALWLFLKEKPPHSRTSRTTLKSDLPKRQHYIDLLKNPQTICIALIGFSLWAPISVFAELWGIPFLMKAESINNLNAATHLQWIWIGVGVGGPVMGWLSDHLKSRKKPIITALLLALIADLLIIYTPSPHSAYLLHAALFIFGLSAATQCVTFGLVRDVQPLSIVGAGIGVNNMAVILGGTLLQPLSGWLLEQFWMGEMHHHVHLYTEHAYRMTFTMMPIGTILGLMLTLFCLKETRCQPVSKRGQHG